MKWFGPDSGPVEHAELDVRVGGGYSIGFRTEDGEQHYVSGVYREVVPNEKLVFTWSWRSTPERESLVTVLIKPDGAGSLADPQSTSNSSTKKPATTTARVGAAASTSSCSIFRNPERRATWPRRLQSAAKTSQRRRAGFHGSFCWNELMTRDIEGAKRFYRDTIGWTFEPMKMDWGTYWLAKAGGKNVGGLFELKGPEFDGVPESWMSYLAVDDVDKRVAKAVKAGAKLMKPIFDVPGVGRIAILMQPGGAGVGWMTPKPD